MKIKDLITICDLLEENLTEFDELQADDGKWIDIHEALYEISEELRKRQWIPVSERLPEEADGTVLVCMPNESPYNEREQFINAKHNQQVETAHYSQYSDTWYFAMGAVSETRPVAWMPLPEPYEKEQE